MTRLSLAYGVLFLSIGIHQPFFPLWLAAQGLDPAQIGLVLALPLLQRSLTLPWTTALAGRFGALKWALALYSALCLAAALLYLVPGGFVFLAAVTVALALVWMPTTPILDALTMGRARRYGFDYGLVRAWGSISFALAVLAFGALANAFGIGILVPLLAACFAMSVLVSLLLPPDAPAGEVRPGFGLFEGWGLLLARPGLVVTLLGCGLVQASHALFYGFAGVHWTALGHSEAIVGLGWGVGVAAEIGFLLVSGRLLARFGLSALLAAGCGAAVLRWTALAVDPPLAVLLPMQALHGLTFAATHVATVNLLAAAVPARLGAVAQGAYSALLGGLNGASFLAAGALYAALQGGGFAAMAGLALVGGGLIALGERRRRAALTPRVEPRTGGAASPDR